MCLAGFSPDGAKYRRSFNFVNDIICGEAAPKVLVRKKSTFGNQKT
jgi:hypothetical protein